MEAHDMGEGPERGDGEQPEILDTETEREVLFQRLADGVAPLLWDVLTPALLVDTGVPPRAILSPEVSRRVDTLARLAVIRVLGGLRALSARQLAILLAQEADQRERHVIHEPPRYTPEEVSGGTPYRGSQEGEAGE